MIDILKRLRSVRGKYVTRTGKRAMKLEPEFYGEMLRLSMESVKAQIALVEQEYRADLDCMEQIRKMRHDLKHHLAVLSTLLSDNDLDTAKAYINELSGELPQTPLDGKNRLTKGFLGKYMQLCRSGGITLVSDIRYDEDALTDKTRLGLILGNALQNAYEAALNAPERGLRQVRIEGRAVQNTLLLVVENGYDGNLEPDYQTTKAGSLHGYGLPSIRKAAESAGGYVEIEHTQQQFRLTVALTIDERALKY
ncbi:GHKL domain-containing protein [Anoxybacterium hadale]|uniref:GHKL domain-containing protein n=1 Tax=Anoxybacterium hadale TaxID=3408580 RepID=A0ACD1A9M1_9FIRM|nr:GHKL domain-containing protein [Clostridiales bacterium]